MNRPYGRTGPRGHAGTSVNVIIAVVAVLVLVVILHNNFAHAVEQVLQQLRAVLQKGW